MGIEELGAVLRETRVRRGMSQQALADKAALSRNFVAQIERGESTPTVATVSRLAAALATTVGELLGEADPRRASPATRWRCRWWRTASPPAPPSSWPTTSRGTSRCRARSCAASASIPAQAMLVRVGRDQDSMADTIPPGATVLLDRAPRREIVPQGIYAVREDAAGETGCTIKRLVLDAASRVLILLSDNPAHLPRAIRLRAGQSLSDVIVGRVVWWAPPTPPRR